MPLYSSLALKHASRTTMELSTIIPTPRTSADNVTTFKVYPESQREYSVLKTENFGEIIQMEIGAMLVGKIVNHNVSKFKRGEEKGYFLYGGSTVILIVKENAIEIDQDILDTSSIPMEIRVKQGEKIARAKG